VIVSFGDRATEDLYHGVRSSRARGFPPEIRRSAIRKLDMIHTAHTLLDLRSPPGNRLEVLKGGREGLHSIRINEQWRVVFRWESKNAHEVSIIDYH
jgi:proteic killer suppression protein